MKRILCVIFSIITVNSWVKAEDKISEKNWNNNAMTVAVRELYTSIENSLKRGDLARSEKNVWTEGDAIDRVEVYFDNDRICRLTETVSDAAKSTSTENYYDKKGILRYIVLNDTANYPDRNKKKESREFHLYFDGSGKLFWIIARVNGKDSYLKGSVPKEDSFLEEVIRKYKDPQNFYDSIEEDCPCIRNK